MFGGAWPGAYCGASVRVNKEWLEDGVSCEGGRQLKGTSSHSLNHLTSLYPEFLIFLPHLPSAEIRDVDRSPCLFFNIKKLHLFILSMCLEVRGLGSSLLPHGSLGLNSGRQACQQLLLPNELSWGKACLSYMVLGIKSRTLCTLNKHRTNWTTSPGLQ